MLWGAMQKFHMKGQDIFSEKLNKNFFFKMSSAEVVIGVLRVKKELICMHIFAPVYFYLKGLGGLGAFFFFFLQ